MNERALITCVYVGLLCLTVVTVGLAQLGVGRAAAVLLALVVASLKAGLIGWHFMELKKESGFVYTILGIGVLAVAILAIGILPDVGGKW